MIKRLCAMFTLLLVWVAPLHAQKDIDYTFTARPDGDEVFLYIVIKAGSICQGIFIERSTDSLKYTQVGNIPGVCGSSAADVPYTFTDAAPVPNTVNYYRVRFGGFGYSQTVPVLYVQLNGGYKLFPNPAGNTAVVYFSNANRAAYKLTVTNLHGQVVYVLNDIKDEKVTIDVSALLPGTYAFRLQHPDVKGVEGKLVVAR